MRLIDELLSTLPDGPVRNIQVGAFWTAVVVELEGHRRCGLASTLRLWRSARRNAWLNELQSCPIWRCVT